MSKRSSDSSGIMTIKNQFLIGAITGSFSVIQITSKTSRRMIDLFIA